ncbi:MAG: hypothetical protein HUU20_04675 [Pirellulales bacterium]|nr:hypothetical protein [Pirellulales bacterium]
MRPWLNALVVLACLAAAGCRTDPNIVLLERENRELEDTVYELQSCLEEYQQALDSCRKQNQALAARLSGEADTVPQPAVKRPEPSSAPAGPKLPTRKPSPAPAPVPPDALVPPTIDLGTPLPERQLPETFKAPDQPPKPPAATAPPLNPALTPPSAAPSVPGPGKSSQASPPDAAEIAAISIRKEQTSGFNLDGRNGDDGVRALIEPRDAAGRPCQAAGPISVVVLDPALSGDAARVARWDFTPEEISQMAADDGIRLEMVWPQSPPSHSRLKLYVRYTTDDGRRLEANCPIEVAIGPQHAENGAPALLPQAVSGTGKAAPQWQGRAAPPQPATPETPRTTRSAAPPGRLQSAVVSQPEAQRPAWSPNRR